MMARIAAQLQRDLRCKSAGGGFATYFWRRSFAAIVNDIVAEQKKVATFDYRPKLAELDEVIAKVYDLTQGERDELSTWYRRHYPKLTGDGTDEA